MTPLASCGGGSFHETFKEVELIMDTVRDVGAELGAEEKNSVILGQH